MQRCRRSGLVELDDDTVLSAGSFEASLRAAGGAILAVDEVMAGRAKNAFVAIRPAGHHAEATTAMGFCLFNNAAIAARHAQRRYRAERVAIVDFDAHHDNGSQQIFWSDRTVMYCSTHEMPSGLTSLSSQLVSMHTNSTRWQTSISPRTISAGRHTGSWRSLI